MKFDPIAGRIRGKEVSPRHRAAVLGFYPGLFKVDQEALDIGGFQAEVPVLVRPAPGEIRVWGFTAGQAVRRKISLPCDRCPAAW